MRIKGDIRKIAKYLPVGIGLTILLYILWCNYSPLGHQVIDYDFSRQNPFTKGLEPTTRVEPIECNDRGCSQEIFGDPTYIDLLLPRKFEHLTVELTYESKKIPLSLGLKSAEGWNYILSPLEMSDSNGITTGKATFNLDQAYIVKRTANIMLSVPALKDGADTLIISRMRFILDRESFLRKVIRKIKSI